MFRSGNPTLSAETFNALSRVSDDEAMTLQGTVNKSMFLLVCVVMTATMTWTAFYRNPGLATALMVGGAIIGFVFAMITCFAKTWSAVTAPLYALAEGCVLGGISSLFEASYPGIVIQGVALTFGTFFMLLVAYQTRLIKPTENFKLGIFAATGGICVVYLISMVMGIFGRGIPYIHEAGPIGIGFSLVVVVIAALNLVLDFDFIEKGAESNAPKYMEWYAAFGLIVTLVWLYMEILRLLSKLRERR